MPDEFKDRLENFFQELNSEEDKNILVVSHGIVSKMLESIKNKKDPENFWDSKGIKNGEIIKIDWIK